MKLFECAYGFGDCLMNVPLLKAYSETMGEKVCVATRSANFDAFYNLDFIETIYPISSLHEGRSVAVRENLRYVQATQHHCFNRYRAMDPHHSLVDTPKVTGEFLNVHFDNKPIIIPTEEELAKTEELAGDVPVVALEADCNSSQAWSTVKDYREFCRKRLGPQYKLLWLSLVPKPDLDYVDGMERFTRRECIAALRHCDLLITTGSGICVGAFGLERKMQPKKIIMTFKSSDNSRYKIVEKLNEYQHHPNIEYAWNITQANHYIKNFRKSVDEC
jgi:hypothetical protein